MKPTLRLVRKAVTLLTAASLVFPASVFAAATDLADVPMAVQNTVYPNVMFTLDDSGSMQWDVMPDFYTNTSKTQGAFFVFPRPDTLYGNTYSSVYGTITNPAELYNGVVKFDLANKYTRYFRTAKFNPLYYNPETRYQPWSKADGSLWGNITATAAPFNPDNAAEGTLNLTIDQTYTTAWLEDDGTEVSSSVTYYPSTYYTYGGTTCAATLTGPADPGNVLGCFTRVDIKSTSGPYTPATFPKAAGRTDCAASTCSYSEEIQNFANWFSYYRSRILTARAGVGRAFSRQGEAMRVGFGAINKGSTKIDGVSTATIINGVRKFTGTDRTAFFTTLYSHIMPAASTPLRQAMNDVGQYFSRTDNKGPWGQTPGSATGTQYSCRANYHILMTDGYWNTGAGAAATADARLNNDGTAGSAISPPPPPAPLPTPPDYTYAPVTPYTDSYSDTLADVAMYYWKRDLRTDTAMTNNVPTNSKDPAFWQHMVNFTIGLGVTGTVPSASISAAFTTSPVAITWLNPTLADANKVDDLAHAAINSRGGFFSASDPTTFAKSLSDALNDIVSRSGAAAAVAVANANLVPGDSMSYASGYNSGDWSGELSAYTLDPATGIPSTTSTWTAQAQLDLVAASTRKIASYTGTSGTGQGIQFQPTTASTTTKLSSAQQTLLNTTSLTDGEFVVAYLRGKEGSDYRTRAHVLGDIVNAEPVIVREPRAGYTDSGYTAFKAGSAATRTKVVYQGANDGMLHAFDAANGSELWAYVPNLLMSSLNSLSVKTGFSHRYFVDGTPAAGDLDFNKTNGASGSPDWHTILVGGLGKGGRGYYALDVTSPTAADEAAVASKVLWEFPNSATSATNKSNMGYSFGRPILAKTKAEGWVALVTSGYNNGADTSGDGKGYLYVLNPRTGDVIATIGTTVGSSTAPSGLAYISAYAENSDIDNTIDYVYGGDLQGNVWRFDLSGTTSSAWNVKKLATLVDGSSAFQPITTTPELAKISYAGSFKRLVYVGTGQYLGTTDVPGVTGASSHAIQTQTMYVLLDDLSSSPTITSLRSSLVAQTVTAAGVFTTSTVDYSTKKGWYIDLPTTGQRINTDPVIGLMTLAFTANTPSSDPCTPGGSSHLYSMDYAYEAGRSSYITATDISLGDALASRPVLVKTESGVIKALIRKSDATTTTSTIPTTGGGSTTKRVSWRELPEQ